MAKHVSVFVRKVSDLTVEDWSYIVVALKELGIARAKFALVPAQQIVDGLRTRCAEDNVTEQAQPELQINKRKVAWAIAAVAARVPWRSDCLLQAMAAQRWLARHHLRATFYLGVSKTHDEAFKAHVWLCLGDMIIAGRSGAGFEPLIEPERTTTASSRS